MHSALSETLLAEAVTGAPGSHGGKGSDGDWYTIMLLDGVSSSGEPIPFNVKVPTARASGYFVQTSFAVQTAGVQGSLQNGDRGTNRVQPFCSLRDSSANIFGCASSKKRPIAVV